jgi:hypothetical protein
LWLQGHLRNNVHIIIIEMKRKEIKNMKKERKREE